MLRDLTRYGGLENEKLRDETLRLVQCGFHAHITQASLVIERKGTSNDCYT